MAMNMKTNPKEGKKSCHIKFIARETLGQECIFALGKTKSLILFKPST